MHKLELTREQVITLKLIFNRIGGSPSNSPRMYIEQIQDLLCELYTEYDCFSDKYTRIKHMVDGTITFKPFETEVITNRLPF